MKEEAKVEVNPMKVEIEAKVAKYEEEIKAHRTVGNTTMADAIQKEVDNLKREVLRY